LYENGFITYMRTDSVTLSDTAIRAARHQVRELFGAEYLPEVPRTKPPCCDEDDRPPAVDGAVLDDLVRRARSLHR